MVLVLAILCVLLAMFAGLMLYEFTRYRRRLHEATQKQAGLPIPAVTLDAIDPVFAPTRYGHTIACETRPHSR